MRFLDSLVAGTLPLIPRSLVWRVAKRYIAGLELEDAVQVIQDLRNRGFFATVDLLGENVSSQEEAIRARDQYCSILERLHSSALPSGISVKLTQLGLRVSFKDALKNLEFLAKYALKLDRFVRIDMEDSSTTDATIKIYQDLHKTYSNIGIVLQAYLRRSYEDALALIPHNPDIRICKGIYKEPENIAFQDFKEIQKNFLHILRFLLKEGASVAIATHDSFLIEEGLRMSRDSKQGPLEFQMLLGVAEPMWDRISSSNNKLRIYVPFGRNWYDYSVRRLRENPQIAGYVLRGLFQ